MNQRFMFPTMVSINILYRYKYITKRNSIAQDNVVNLCNNERKYNNKKHNSTMRGYFKDQVSRRIMFSVKFTVMVNQGITES